MVGRPAVAMTDLMSEDGLGRLQPVGPVNNDDGAFGVVGVPEGTTTLLIVCARRSKPFAF